MTQPSPVPAGTEREALARVLALHSGTHQCGGGNWYTGDPDYRGSIAKRDPCPTALAAAVSSSPATPEGEREAALVASYNAGYVAGYEKRDGLAAPPPASPAETREGPERAVHYATIWANLAAPWCDPPHLWDWPLAQDPSQVTCPDCIDAAGIEAAASPAVSLPGEQPGGEAGKALREIRQYCRIVMATNGYSQNAHLKTVVETVFQTAQIPEEKRS